MTKINFVDHSGETRTVDADAGSTVMEAAIRNNIPGIEAECGGACACATCHVYIDEDWRDKVGKPTPMEEDMLDFGYDVRPNSRLSCQIKVTRRTRRPGGYGTGAAGLSASHSRLMPAHKAASGVTLAGRCAGAATVYGFPQTGRLVIAKRI